MSHYELIFWKNPYNGTVLFTNLLSMATQKKNPSIAALNHLLAAFTVTAQNARFAHWNVVGPVFEDNHEMFEDLYNYLADEVDVFAERIRALQAYPMSQLAEYLKETSITELALPMNAAEMQKAILGNLEHISGEMHEFIQDTEDDHVTQDMIIGSKAQIDKKAWMFRAMLGK